MGVARAADPSQPAGRRQTYPLRRIVDAIFSLLRTRAQWRLLPHEVPPRTAIFYPYAQWREGGTWAHVTQALRESYRRTIGRTPQPTAAIIDSQSVKTTEMGRPRGYDGGKKIKGRKRHLLVDTQVTLLKTKVHPADIHDRARPHTAGDPDEHLMAVLGNINGYQGGRSEDRIVLGHGRTASSACSATSL
jgi:transposase